LIIWFIDHSWNKLKISMKKFINLLTPLYKRRISNMLDQWMIFRNDLPEFNFRNIQSEKICLNLPKHIQKKLLDESLLKLNYISPFQLHSSIKTWYFICAPVALRFKGISEEEIMEIVHLICTNLSTISHFKPLPLWTSRLDRNGQYSGRWN
jgi:hypothetical protein